MAEFEETEYAEEVVEWLENRDWEVFKEVEAPKSGRVVDIYAIQGPRDRVRDSWAVEVKTGFTLRLMEQAHYWRRHANKVSVAFPSGIDSRTYTFGRKVCSEFGMGVFEVVEGNNAPMYAKKKAHPSDGHVATFPPLHEEQKHYDAGNADNEHFSKFEEFGRRLTEHVKEHEGISLPQAIDELDHHYKSKESAYSTLKRAIRNRALPDLKIEWADSTPFLFLK